MSGIPQPTPIERFGTVEIENLKAKAISGAVDISAATLSGLKVRQEGSETILKKTSEGRLIIRPNPADNEPLAPSSQSSIVMEGQGVTVLTGKPGVADMAISPTSISLNTPLLVTTGNLAVGGSSSFGGTTTLNNIVVTGTSAIPVPSATYFSSYFSSPTASDTVFSAGTSTTIGEALTNVTGALFAKDAGGVSVYSGFQPIPELDIANNLVYCNASRIQGGGSQDLAITSGIGSPTKLVLSCEGNSGEGLQSHANLTIQDNNIRIYSGFDSVPNINLINDRIVDKMMQFGTYHWNGGGITASDADSQLTWPITNNLYRCNTSGLTTSLHLGEYSQYYTVYEGMYMVSGNALSSTVGARFSIWKSNVYSGILSGKSGASGGDAILNIPIHLEAGVGVGFRTFGAVGFYKEGMSMSVVRIGAANSITHNIFGSNSTYTNI